MTTTAARLATLRASAGLPARTDLSLEDVRYIDKHAAHVVVRYAGEVPPHEQVQEWLSAASKSEGKELTARADTLRSHPDISVISFGVEKAEPTSSSTSRACCGVPSTAPAAPRS